MGKPGKQFHVRLTPDLARKFEALANEFSGLQPGTVLRLLVAAELDRPLHEQVEVITNQIKKPGVRRKDAAPGQNRSARIAGGNH